MTLHRAGWAVAFPLVTALNAKSHNAHIASLPLSARKLEMSLSKPSSRATVPPTKVLKSAFQQHALPCVPPASPFAPGTAAAELQPSDGLSRQEPVAAAAVSWGPSESTPVLAAAQLGQPALNNILSGLKIIYLPHKMQCLCFTVY